jgi:signal transduction histidine kinase
VCDRGPGIPEDEIEEIFEKFVQSSKTKTGAGGTGLGLSISRQILFKHEGRIRVANRAGGGACFHIELPARLRLLSHQETSSIIDHGQVVRKSL